MSSLSNFQKLKELGKGSFSTVYKVCRKSDNKEYAMKVVKITQLSEKERQNALNEIRILASIADPNIIAYKEAFFDEGIRCLCIIMEYADAGDLMQKINAKRLQKAFFPEAQLWKFLIQMTKGLRTLHNLKILHRDLKCANIFQMNDGSIKLGDLNVSKITQKGLAITQAGTPYYCAPEVWKGNVYDKKCDIWSLGCVLYELATLKPPFQGTGMKDLFNRISKGEFERIPKCYSNELYEIIKHCLKINANDRPTCDEIFNYQVIRERFPEEITKERVISKAQLLNTIKMPRNLQGLREKLPKPNYQLNNKSFEEEEEERSLRKRCPSECGLKEKVVDLKDKIDVKEKISVRKNYAEDKEKELDQNKNQNDLRNMKRNCLEDREKETEKEREKEKERQKEREREKEKERQRQRERERDRDRERLYLDNKNQYDVKNHKKNYLEEKEKEKERIISYDIKSKQKNYLEEKEKEKEKIISYDIKSKQKNYLEEKEKEKERITPYDIKSKPSTPYGNNPYANNSNNNPGVQKLVIEKPPLQRNVNYPLNEKAGLVKINNKVEQPLMKNEVKSPPLRIERPVSREIKKQVLIEERKPNIIKPSSNQNNVNRSRPTSQKDPRSAREKEKIIEKPQIKHNINQNQKKNEINYKMIPPKTPLTPNNNNKENVYSKPRYPGLEVKNKRKY